MMTNLPFGASVFTLLEKTFRISSRGRETVVSRTGDEIITDWLSKAKSKTLNAIVNPYRKEGVQERGPGGIEKACDADGGSTKISGGHEAAEIRTIRVKNTISNDVSLTTSLVAATLTIQFLPLVQSREDPSKRTWCFANAPLWIFSRSSPHLRPTFFS